MEKTTYLLQAWDPSRNAWQPAEIQVGPPFKRIREMLDGRWTKSSGDFDVDMSAAFWNSGNGRKVFALAMPRGLPLDAAYRIAEARP